VFGNLTFGEVYEEGLELGSDARSDPVSSIRDEFFVGSGLTPLHDVELSEVDVDESRAHDSPLDSPSG
jgi:hypothetical protein